MRLSQRTTSPGAHCQRAVFSGRVTYACSSRRMSRDSVLDNPTMRWAKPPMNSPRSSVSGCTPHERHTRHLRPPADSGRDEGDAALSYVDASRWSPDGRTQRTGRADQIHVPPLDPAVVRRRADPTTPPTTTTVVAVDPGVGSHGHHDLSTTPTCSLEFNGPGGRGLINTV